MLETVIVDSDDYVLNDSERLIVQRQLGARAVPVTGYLTLARAIVAEQTRAQEIAKPYYDLAAQEGRELTDAERQSLQQELGGLPLPGVIYTGTDYPCVFTFDLIEVNGDQAVAEYDNGSVYNRATLRRINGQWFVTGITPLRSHL